MFYSAVYQPSNNLCDSGNSAAGKASAYGCINPGSIFRTGAVLGCNPVVLTRSNRPFYAFDSALSNLIILADLLRVQFLHLFLRVFFLQMQFRSDVKPEGVRRFGSVIIY